MRGIYMTDFSKFLKESFLSVWVDNESAFGTYPLESMVSGTPVIGKTPNMLPEWMNEENGVWTNQFNEMVDVIANFIQNWLEDNISEKLYENMSLTSSKYQNKNKFESKVLELFEDYFTARLDAFQEQLDKLNLTEETNK
jgi:glycosyltransferase involved in cell wall biosynthesis